MSKVINAVDFKIPQSTVEMVARIKPLLTLGDVSGEVLSIKADKTLLAASMEGTDLNPEGMQAYLGHLEEVTNALSAAAGELSAKAFQDNADVKKTQTEAKLVPSCGIDIGITKERQVPNMDRENPGTKTVYGSTVARITMVGATKNGVHKKVRAYNAACVEAICS